jgi:MFS family permease
MDLTVLDLAVPHLSANLQPSSTQLLWIVDIYGFLVAGLLVTMGTLGDRIGHWRLLLAGAAAFGVASVLAGLTSDQQVLAATLIGYWTWLAGLASRVRTGPRTAAGARRAVPGYRSDQPRRRGSQAPLRVLASRR